MINYKGDLPNGTPKLNIIDNDGNYPSGKFRNESQIDNTAGTTIRAEMFNELYALPYYLMQEHGMKLFGTTVPSNEEEFSRGSSHTGSADTRLETSHANSYQMWQLFEEFIRPVGKVFFEYQALSPLTTLYPDLIFTRSPSAYRGCFFRVENSGTATGVAGTNKWSAGDNPPHITEWMMPGIYGELYLPMGYFSDAFDNKYIVKGRENSIPDATLGIFRDVLEVNQGVANSVKIGSSDVGISSILLNQNTVYRLYLALALIKDKLQINKDDNPELDDLIQILYDVLPFTIAGFTQPTGKELIHQITINSDNMPHTAGHTYDYLSKTSSGAIQLDERLPANEVEIAPKHMTMRMYIKTGTIFKPQQ